MKLIFTGQYTGGRTSITISGVTFNGREPSGVADDSPLLTHPEFEAENPIVAEHLGEPPKRRGRPKKGLPDG